jgi:uncharacterized membrane protein YkoI
MKTISQLCRVAIAALLVALPSATAKSRRLPQKPAEVIKANFPDARITGIGRERERGAWYYEVVLHEGKRRFEVEITDDGVIGEIEGKVTFADLPPELQQKVRERVGRGRLVRVEKHERRGVARSGEFVPLSKTRISYEIKYYNASGERRELQLASDLVMELPAKVRAMVAQRFPNAQIEEAEVEDDDGVLLHVISLRQEDSRFTVVASSEGDVVEYEVAIEPHALPQAARNTLKEDKDYRQAKDPRVVAWETFGAVEGGKLVSRRDRTYMVTLRKNGQIKEYRFDGRGRVTSKTDWTAADDDDDGGDEGDDDD